MARTKFCKFCATQKSIKRFSPASQMRDGRASMCNHCHYLRYKKGRGKTLYRKYWAKRIVWGAKQRAARSGVKFDLAASDIIVPKRCPVLGIPLRIGTSGMSSNSPTLDRIIPRKGYIKGNVAVISWKANKIKGDVGDPTIFDKIATYMRRR